MSNQASLAGITSRFPLSTPYPSAYGWGGLPAEFEAGVNPAKRTVAANRSA